MADRVPATAQELFHMVSVLDLLTIYHFPWWRWP